MTKEIEALEDDIDRYVELSKQALDAGDLSGAIEQARFAARAVGILKGLDRNTKRSLPCSSYDNKVRQLYGEIIEHTR